MNVVFRLKATPSLKLRYLPGIVGPSGSVTLGTVATGAAGTNVIITNTGTPQAAVLNFTIPRGNTGVTGDKGWSPILAIVTDSARRVVQISDWTGGQGTKPAVGDYIGPTGLTSVIANAVDIRGPIGATGPAVADGDKGDITVSGTGTVFTIDPNVTTDAKLRQSAGLSVIGRSANTTGNVADITAVTDGHVMRLSGTTLGFGTTATAGIADTAVTNAKLANMATSTIKGRRTAGTGVPEDLTPLQAAVLIGAPPVGSIVDYAGTTAPSGYLLAYGQAVSRTTYALLFAVLSTTYGVGDGSTTFNLPDLRGRIAAGKDDMGGSAASRITSGVSGITGTTLGAAGGDQQIAAHTHSISGFSGSNNGTAGAHFYNTNQNNTSGATGSTGGGASGNVQPTIILNKIIFAGV